MKLKINRKIMIIISSTILVLVILLIIFQNISVKHFTFYYPDDEWKNIAGESRVIKIKKSETDTLELRMVKEYLLGPVNYHMRLDIPDTVLLLNVWAVSNKILIINFNSDFETFAKINIKECSWFIKGFMETIKKNTRYKKILFLEEDVPVKAVVDGKNLVYPLSIFGETKKTL